MKLHPDDIHEHNLTDSQGAVFSPCRTYRYLLYRTWQAPHPEDDYAVCFVGLNPSTADASIDDPTIRRCVAFAKRQGYSRLWMLNLCAFRATKPRDMKAAEDPIGPNNRDYLRHYTNLADDTVCCWGRNADDLESGMVIDLWRCIQRPTWCLGKTGSGQPKHPLYLPDSTELVPYNRLPLEVR